MQAQNRPWARVKDPTARQTQSSLLPHPEDLPGIAVIHLDVEFLQKVLQLLEAHLVVLVFVSFSQARVNPAG